MKDFKKSNLTKNGLKTTQSLVSFYDNSIIRAAYVTFANEESVDKAVALSGTTFYSRTVKVLRKAEAASAATAPAQPSAKPFHAHGNRKAIPNKPRYPSSSLQWRREPSTDPTEAEPPSGPASVEVVSSSAPKHLPDTDKEGNASSTERAATRST
ncbi:hypothetical protein Prudu_008107 [Prunus dulcis]|uniref:RRM domain-containing protein n=1 Tax=Prunus dulcis TaxID=3755 RepID=A0A4Y1R3P6_PRUDU|nr:hypothetical protein Prudu_008107 [Prunus dulcis]